MSDLHRKTRRKTELSDMLFGIMFVDADTDIDIDMFEPDEAETEEGELDLSDFISPDDSEPVMLQEQPYQSDAGIQLNDGIQEDAFPTDDSSQSHIQPYDGDAAEHELNPFSDDDEQPASAPSPDRTSLSSQVGQATPKFNCLGTFDTATDMIDAIGGIPSLSDTFYGDEPQPATGDLVGDIISLSITGAPVCVVSDGYRYAIDSVSGDNNLRCHHSDTDVSAVTDAELVEMLNPADYVTVSYDDQRDETGVVIDVILSSPIYAGVVLVATTHLYDNGLVAF